MNDVLTVKEAAALLRVSQKTIYRAVAEGTMPAIKVGSAIRLSKEAILKGLAVI